MKLVIVLDHQSRYDRENKRPLAGPAGDLVSGLDYTAIYKGDPLPPHTTHILCSGFCQYGNLDEQRGYIRRNGAGQFVQYTYFAQDCVDRRDYESIDDDDEDDSDREGTGKDRAPTSRQNYRFWFMRDLAKLLATTDANYTEGRVSVGEPCGAVEMVNYLNAQRGTTLFFDIETHPMTNTLQCFSIAGPTGLPMSFVVYTHGSRLAPGALDVMVALVRAFRRNTVVIHNAMFDLEFLAHYHGVPFGTDIHDTMLMHHRMYPEAEKSLAHCISLYINAPYHKDEAGTFNPHNWQQMRKLVQYNAMDVLRLRQIHKAMWTHDPAAHDSMRQANESIYPYIMASLTGIDINYAALKVERNKLQRRAAQINRMAKLLIGRDINLGSSQQLGTYLYEGMNYPILARTGAGAPAVGADTLYRLQLKHKNPMIELALAYKSVAKEASMLGFTPYLRLRRR